MKSSSLIFIALIVFASSSAFANGGPVAWTKTSTMGAVALVQQESATLKEERLEIEIKTLNEYSVRAKYIVDSHVADQKVTFGVPVRWTWSDIESKGLYNRIARDSGPDKFSDSINITIDQKRVACVPVESMGDAEKSLPEGVAGVVRSWCVADFDLKKGRNVIELSYKSELEYVDMEFSKSAFTEFEDRLLNYLFLPAGYWGGHVETVVVDIALGPYAGQVKSTTPDLFHISNGHMVWKGTNVDFKEIPQMSILFEKSLLEANQLATWNAALHYVNFKDSVIVNASSSLPDSGKVSYKPGNLLDGKPQTAWCADKKTNKGAAKITFKSRSASFGESQKEYCRLEALVLTDGYMKSQKVYSANNKIRKIAISDCMGNHRQEFAFKNKLKEDFRLSPEVIKNYYQGPLDFIKGTNCFQVEIIEVEKGKDDDTCISEFSVVTNCG